MQMSQLKPAGSFAANYGVKMILYGPPGSGKTPLINTAPRPVLLAVEPGLLSMRNSKVPTWEGYTLAKIKEFFDWFFKSKEADNFDTLGIDSFSQIAEITVIEKLKNIKHGKQAYGEMASEIMELANRLYFHPRKHICLIAKQGTVDEAGTLKRRPFFPGQDLNVRMPHLFDAILHVDNAQVPGFMQPVKAIRTKSAIDILARDRSGMLNEFEPPDLGALIAKAMQ